MLVQWKPLNVITVNVISWHSSHLHYIGVDYYVQQTGYCYHSVNVISFSLAQRDHIKPFHCSWKFVNHKKIFALNWKSNRRVRKKLEICCRKNIFYFSPSINHKCVIYNKINKGEKEIVKRYSRTSLCQEQLWGKILNLNVHKRNFLKQANRRPTVLLNPSTCVRVSFALSPELETQLHRVWTSPPVPPKNSREGIRFDAIHQNRF